MGVRQRVRHRRGNGECVVHAERLSRQALAQRAALEVGHHIIEEATRFTGVVQRQDVGVGEPGRDLDFLEESLHAEEGGEAGEEHLEGDLAAMLAVVGEVHRRHPAAAQHAAQRVALAQRGLQVDGDLGSHGNRI
jgi:hypothetical protein